MSVVYTPWWVIGVCLFYFGLAVGAMPDPGPGLRGALVAGLIVWLGVGVVAGVVSAVKEAKFERERREADSIYMKALASMCPWSTLGRD